MQQLVQWIWEQLCMDAYISTCTQLHLYWHCSHWSDCVDWLDCSGGLPCTNWLRFNEMLLSYFCCFKVAALLGAIYWVHSVHEVMYYGSWCCMGMCLDSTGIRYIHISGDGIFSVVCGDPTTSYSTVGISSFKVVSYKDMYWLITSFHLRKQTSYSSFEQFSKASGFQVHSNSRGMECTKAS